MTTPDPVELVTTGAKSPASSTKFRVTGVMMQYYFVCERELWFHSRDISIDRTNPNIVRGTNVDDTAYSEERREISVDNTIKIDVLQDGRVLEVKPSSAMTEPARMQLLYYLWYLDRIVGVEKTGVLAHPTERRRESVELTQQNARRVEDAIRGIYDVINQSSPPPAEEKPYCEGCAYHDFCWSC